MKKILTSMVFVVAAFLLVASLASAQSLTTMPASPLTASQSTKAPNLSSTATYAPSEIAVAPSGTPTDHPIPRRQRTALGDSAAFGRRASEGLNLPHLCFQPGVGWTVVPSAAFAPVTGANDKPLGTDKSSGDLSRSLHRGLYPAGKSGGSEGCLQTQTAVATFAAPKNDGVRDDSSLSIDHSYLTSQSSRTIYSGIQPPLTENSLLGGDTPVELTGDLRSKGGISNDPSAALGQLKTLRQRAYISPVKLRRLSRGMQSLETRFELRQMNTEVQKRKAGQTSEDKSTGIAAKKAALHIPLNSSDLRAKKGACDRKGGASKSRVCTLLTH